jgi:hypothetical protein
VPRVYFYLERGRTEVDIIIEQGADLVAVEVKASRTPSAHHFDAIETFARRVRERGDARWRLSRRMVVYGGDESQDRSAGELVAWRRLPDVDIASAG